MSMRHLSTSDPIAGRRHLRPGCILFHEGDAADFAYEVVGGMLKLSKVTAEGRLLVIDFPAAGELVGLTDEDGYACTAQAVDESWVRPVPRGSLLREDGHAEHLLRLVCDRERAMHAHLLLLSLRHPVARIAAFLRAKADGQDGAPIRLCLPMARRDIADHLAITPETMCRIMRRLHDGGVINVLRRDKIEIVDPVRLDRLADGGDFSKLASWQR